MTTSEPGPSEVFTHGLTFRPELDRVAREQAGAEHHGGVGGVGARGDRGDHDRAVGEFAILVGDADLRLRLGGEVLGLRLVAAFGVDAHDFGLLRRAVGGEAFEVGVEVVLDLLEQHAVLRALRAGERGLDVAQVEFERRRVRGVRRVRVVPQALRLRVGLDQRDLLVRCGPTGAGSSALRRRSGRCRRSRRIRAPCWRSSRGRRAAGAAGRRRRTRRTCRPRRARAASA